MFDATISTLLDESNDDGSLTERQKSLINLDLINNFSFDFESQLQALAETGNATLASLESAPTTITSSLVVWGDDTNGVTLSGVNLSGIGDVEQLQADLAAGIAAGEFTALNFIADGNTILSVIADETGETLISGNQEIKVTGQLPSTFQELFDATTAVVQLVGNQLSDIDDANFATITAVLDQFSLSGIQINDGNDEIASLSIGSTAVTLSLAGLTATLTGTFDIENFGDAAEILRRVVILGDEFELEDVPELAITGLDLVGADGTVLINLEGEPSEVFDTVTLVGTDDNDRNISLDGIINLEADEYKVELGDGGDELEIDIFNFLDRVENGDPLQDIQLDGGASEEDRGRLDELDFSADAYGIYDVNFATGKMTGRVDPNALFDQYDPNLNSFVKAAERYDEDNAQDLFDITFAEFESIDIDIRSGGQITVTGDDDRNIFDMESLPNYFEIDGGGGFDTLKFDNLAFFFEAFVQIDQTPPESMGNLEEPVAEDAPANVSGYNTLVFVTNPTKEEFFNVFDVIRFDEGNLGFYGAGTTNLYGAVNDVEEFVFYLNEDENESLLTEDLFPTIVVLGTDGNDAKVQGNDNDNSIFGGKGNDTLVGEEGDDILDGGSGRDTMFGGIGDDVFIFDNPRDRAREGAGEGYDIVRSTAEVTLSSSEIEVVELEGSGNLRVNGNQFATEIFGNSGSNILVGGGGGDTITGGDGNDFFAFLTTDAEGVTTITDFSANDKFAIDDRFFGLGDGSIDIRNVTEAQFSNAMRSKSVVYDGSTGEFYIDVDGRGGPAQQELLFTVEGGGRLEIDDFLLF